MVNLTRKEGTNMKKWIRPSVLASYSKMDLVANETNGDWMNWIYSKSWGRA